MPDLDDLWLHEQLLLLALHDEKGTMQSVAFEVGAGGAILCELLLGGRITLEPAGRRKRPVVKVRDTAAPGDPILEEALRRMQGAKRQDGLVAWAARLAGTKRLRHRIAERLRHRGILGKREGRVLLVFSRDLYPTANPAPERELVERIRRAVLGDGEVAARTAILVTLANQLGLLRPILTRQELKARRRRLAELATLEGVEEGAREAVESVKQVMAAQAAAVVVAAT
jgi:hypothetical protein